MIYDVIILGGGPAGYEAAVKCSEAGSRVLMIENQQLGGTCLNRGCIPTKALLSLSEKKTDFFEMQREKDKRVKELRKGLEDLILNKNIDVRYGRGYLVGRRSIVVDGDRYTAQNVIIATGSLPKMLDIDLEGRNVITSDEALFLDNKPRSVVIIGGGIIGLEFAVYFSNLKVKTTVIEYEDRLIPIADKELSSAIREHLSKIGIEIHTSTKIKRISRLGTVCVENNKISIIDGEIIMMAVGRYPDLSGVKLADGSEIKTEKGAIVVDEYMQTNIKGIYAIGDINGKCMLAHAAYMQADVAAMNIIEPGSKIMDHSLVPSCVYTQPEVAWVGHSLETALDAGYDAITRKSDFISNGRAAAIGGHGFVKVVADKKTKKILGVHIIGEYAAEIITQATIAIKFNATAYDFQDIIFPHPTISEVFKDAVLKMI